MITLIEPQNYAYHRHSLTKMYKLRDKVFHQKLGWNVTSVDGLERDAYDEQKAYYLLYQDKEGNVRACHRLIPMTEHTMFDGTFQNALPQKDSWKKQGYWECSRFAVDPDLRGHREGQESFQQITSEMFSALMQVGLDYQIECFLTLMYPEMERLIKKRGFLTITLNETMVDQEKVVVSAFFPTHYTLDRIQEGLPTKGRSDLWYTFNIAA